MPKRGREEEKKERKPYDPGKEVEWKGMKGRAQPGWQTKVVRLRPRRSFGQEREAQVLRHISGQLFLWVTKHKICEPVEIQMMYANESVFIGTNTDKATNILADKVLNNSGQLQMALDKVWCKKGETHERSSRAARKLKRLDEWDPDEAEIDTEDKFLEFQSRFLAKHIYDIVRTKTAKALYCKDISATKAALSENRRGKLYYVLEGNNDGRHIEEKLNDILENASYKDIAVIAGVKRPCGTCWIRLESAKKDGYYIDSNPNPGNIWKGQAETLKLDDDVIEEYINYGTTRSESGGKAWDSGSDSEGDDDSWFSRKKKKKK